MLKARIALILTGLTFAIWETVDIFQIEVPAVAAFFAVSFFACTMWFWRRDSGRPPRSRSSHCSRSRRARPHSGNT
jgi:hypothetical protein